MTEKKALKDFENAVQNLIAAFEKKQNLRFEDLVGDDMSGVACFNDIYFFSIADIYEDLKHNAPKGLIVEWQEHCLEHKKSFNYQSYRLGLRADLIKNKKKWK